MKMIDGALLAVPHEGAVIDSEIPEQYRWDPSEENVSTSAEASACKRGPNCDLAQAGKRRRRVNAVREGAVLRRRPALGRAKVGLPYRVDRVL